MSGMKKIGLMLGLMAATMNPSGEGDYKEFQKRSHVGGSKIRSRRKNDYCDTVRRLKINERRKAEGLKPIRSLTRFGGYKIPLV